MFDNILLLFCEIKRKNLFIFNFLIIDYSLKKIICYILVSCKFIGALRKIYFLLEKPKQKCVINFTVKIIIINKS